MFGSFYSVLKINLPLVGASIGSVYYCTDTREIFLTLGDLSLVALLEAIPVQVAGTNPANRACWAARRRLHWHRGILRQLATVTSRLPSRIDHQLSGLPLYEHGGAEHFEQYPSAIGKSVLENSWAKHVRGPVFRNYCGFGRRWPDRFNGWKGLRIVPLQRNDHQLDPHFRSTGQRKLRYRLEYVPAGLPTVSSIVSGAGPSLASQQKNQGTTSGWSKTVFDAGDVLSFSILTATTVQFLSLTLQISAS